MELIKEAWEKQDYSKDIRKLLDIPIRNYKDALFLLNCLKAVILICELSTWNIDEVLGGDGTMDLHKKVYMRLTRDSLNEPVDTYAKAQFALRRLRQIEKDCQQYGWNPIEILGGVVDEKKEKSEDEDLTQDIRCAQTGLRKQHVNHFVLPDQLSPQAI